MELLEVKLSFNIILERPECDKTQEDAGEEVAELIIHFLKRN
jgi:hypothetical protein